MYKDNIKEFLKEFFASEYPEAAELRDIVKPLIIEAEDKNKQADGGRITSDMFENLLNEAGLISKP